jgi:hypothetical protein
MVRLDDAELVRRFPKGLAALVKGASEDTRQLRQFPVDWISDDRLTPNGR